MSVLITAFILIAFNILMWAIFLVKFKRLFSTDSIVLATREKINGMIRDLNSNASRNIELLQNEIKQVKSVTAEAERRLALLKKDLEVSEKASAFQQRLASRSSATDVANLPERTEKNTERENPVAEEFSAEERIADIQSPLEETENKSVGKATISSLYGVPLQKSPEPENDADFNISFSDNPIVPQEDFNSKVKELHVLGYSVFDIAEQTGHSVYEVNLAVKMI